MKYYDEGDSSDFFACSANCPKMMARGQEIQKLNEKIREYKDKIKALYAEIRQDNLDIDEFKDTVDTLEKRVEELEEENKKLVAPTKIVLIFHDDANQFELFCNDREISDHVYGALTKAERRIEELRAENKKLKLENECLKLENDQLRVTSFANEVDELKKSNDKLDKELDDMCEENSKLESLKQHLINHVSNKEAEIVNLKEENEKLWNENKCWKDKYETLDKDSTDGSCIYISIPKGQKVSNFEVHFQEENDSNVTPPASLWATVPYASGKGPVTTYGSWTVTTKEDNNGHDDSISE